MLKEDIQDVLVISKGLWLSIRSKRTFVVISGAFYGSIGDAIFDMVQSGRVDFSNSGIHRLASAAVGTSFVAWWHLNRPAPDSTSNR